MDVMKKKKGWGEAKLWIVLSCISVLICMNLKKNKQIKVVQHLRCGTYVAALILSTVYNGVVIRHVVSSSTQDKLCIAPGNRRSASGFALSNLMHESLGP